MARHSTADAARYLGISRTTLYRLIQHGTLSPTPEGLIDDTELVRAASHVDAIKARIARDQAEEAARTERARYVQMLQEFYQRYDRLLDAPRSLPAPAEARPTGSVPIFADRGTMRQRIIALLRDYPDGLSPAQARQQLGAEKDLGATIKAMMRDGLLRRVTLGQYTAID